ncbi:hypothetical protein CcrC1_gp218c [Caulobacter phage C1]|nr:hypothetical protein CcrC1_gp218c [Caulobacter phage C1]UTU08447.1 hypothetical protein CcrC2_gp219c [Caulobacter phage C2]UTU08964.1 hypothetical protein CcrJ4_gp213c [Caulobacter phage J4]UTU09522.1 hypothetical protein CcrBL47_gp236c [Caulobacter phage BL47]UTU10080.1 hypothetical protein CcrRB23_gp218c [Caulobacter phage RB23]WGN97115.1 hypothetical protein [Bertelyvirus sp.]
MAYDFRYSGKLTIAPGLSVKQASLLKRMRKGELPPDAPGYFSFKVNDDGDALKHDGSEGHFEVARWVDYLLRGPLAGHVLNGKIEESCSDFMSQTDIIVEDNVIYISDYELKPGPKKPWTGEDE